MTCDLNLCKSDLAGVGVPIFCAEFSSHNRETPPRQSFYLAGVGGYIF
jgi:hypothetical protein